MRCEISQASALTHCIYRTKVEDLEDEDACLLHFSTTMSFTSPVADYIASVLMGRTWIQKIMNNLIDVYLIQVWHAFDQGWDLCKAIHKLDQFPPPV